MVQEAAVTTPDPAVRRARFVVRMFDTKREIASVDVSVNHAWQQVGVEYDKTPESHEIILLDADPAEHPLVPLADVVDIHSMETKDVPVGRRRASLWVSLLAKDERAHPWLRRYCACGRTLSEKSLLQAMTQSAPGPDRCPECSAKSE